jgi:hypothetical protein
MFGTVVTHSNTFRNVSNGKGPKNATTETRAASAKDVTVTIARLRSILKELKVAVASKAYSDAIRPPSNASIGQVYQLQQEDPDNLVPGWGYMNEFHYTANNNVRWRLFVLEGQLKAEDTTTST